jgi:predicted phage gp36 major capsid-like protein
MEEERQIMEEQRYRTQELETVNDLLQQEMRDKDEDWETRMEVALREQKADLDRKHESDLKWAAQQAEKAQEAAREALAAKSQAEVSDVETLRAQITEHAQQKVSYVHAISAALIPPDRPWARAGHLVDVAARPHFDWIFLVQRLPMHKPEPGASR